MATESSAASPLHEGDLVPDLTLLTDTGDEFRFSSLRGKTAIVYFYPKADTPGCTTEACEFRDLGPEITAQNAVVIGISPDPAPAQAKFKTKYGLPFTLLADTAHAAAGAFGVWKEKSMYGKKYMGVERSTFLIGPDGRISKIFAKVKAPGHAREVLAALHQ